MVMEGLLKDEDRNAELVEEFRVARESAEVAAKSTEDFTSCCKKSCQVAMCTDEPKRATGAHSD